MKATSMHWRAAAILGDVHEYRAMPEQKVEVLKSKFKSRIKFKILKNIRIRFASLTYLFLIFCTISINRDFPIFKIKVSQNKK